MRLETARLILREQQLDDAEATNRYESQPEVMRYQTSDVRTLEESRAYIARVLTDSAAEPRTLFDLAIEWRQTHTLVGRAGLHIHEPELREARLWYVVDPSMWGRGVAVEACRAMLTLAFHTLGVRRVVADIDPRNSPSVRVVEKLGMRREAHLVENVLVKGEWCDSLLYALLDREWVTAD